jgi:hypothetical protein
VREIPLPSPSVNFRVAPVTVYQLLWGALVVLAFQATPAAALVRFDFEQPYYQHTGRQVWDFSLVRTDSVHHIFYHSIHEETPNAAFADTIWHATSTDLRHWQPPVPVLTSGQGYWDQKAVWAPEIFRDDAGARWVLAYTGVDSLNNQRICLAFSDDLHQWTKSTGNPVVEPDPALYIWDPAGTWGDFRDPFIYRQDDQWHLLVTAKQFLGSGNGVIYHGVSDDLENWTDVGPLFIHDGAEKWRVLESVQYKVIGDFHHLLFGEFDTNGVTILSAADPTDWTMANRTILDYGYAPELDEFDPGVKVFSRITPFQLPLSSDLAYVVRFDTLQTDPDGSDPMVVRAHPLDYNWATRIGTANLGNPIFGDNPLWRGEPSVGLVGHGYYGSKEYYHGPLSGRGSPGTQLGDGVTGTLISKPFVVAGDRMTLLVGGGNFPETCYVALVDEADGTILRSETGQNSDPMTPREWDLTPFIGRTCTIHIVDNESGYFGHINVDEIIEIQNDPPPGKPTAVEALYLPSGVDLDWDDAPEEDFKNHRVYRSLDPDFVISRVNLVQQVLTSAWTDPIFAPWDYYYKVTTVDSAGNESPPGIPTAVSAVPGIPATGIARLAAAVPNPFNPSTRLAYELAAGGPVSLKIYDPAGRLIATLVDSWRPAGAHAEVWDGRDDGGRPAAAGVYLYRLETVSGALTRRMTLLK